MCDRTPLCPRDEGRTCSSYMYITDSIDTSHGGHRRERENDGGRTDNKVQPSAAQKRRERWHGMTKCDSARNKMHEKKNIEKKF